jgi:hypothetical protein
VSARPGGGRTRPLERSPGAAGARQEVVASNRAVGKAEGRTGRRLLLLLFLLALPLVTPKLRGADEIEGFAYLRSLVFDGDLEFGNEYEHFHALDPAGLAGFRSTFLELREPDTGRHINFAPIGSAVLWSPFYLLAHAGVTLARGLGSTLPADGFSAPYVAAACYASALYGLAGLLLIHALLLRQGFGEPAASWTVAALWLGTPLLYYTTLAPGFSHACSVFAVALMLWLALREGGTPAPARAALVGAAGGLAGLVREQDLLFLAVPFGLVLASGLRARDGLRTAARLAALTGAAAVAFVPQLLAYRAVNGTFGPSRLVARKMSWSSPHALEVLFDPGHGLFAWSPLALVAVASLAVAGWRRRSLLLGLLLLAWLLQVWVNGAVESWTQAGAFGSRRFLSATAVLAFGLAALLAAALPRVRGAALAAVLAGFAWWNVSLMVQFGLRLMDRQRLDWPRVAVSQVREVPPRLARAAWLFFSDRERLVREGVR